jgi:hypothetical protein
MLSYQPAQARPDPMPFQYRRRLRGATRLAGLVLFVLAALARADQVAWQSGFESGFPGGEWLDLDNGSYSPDGAMPAGRVSAWTIVKRESGEPVFAGNHAYKGWISGMAGDSHRAYPVLHADVATPLVNTFFVYLDTDYERMSALDWIHFGTWGNRDPVAKAGLWALHTLAVRDRKLEFAHTSPFHGEYIGPAPRPDFPLRRWVRLTIYIVYEGGGYLQLWQDGVPMLRAAVPGLKTYPGPHLRTAHWGMYARGSVKQAVQYNDNISICALDTPLTDLIREPLCPAGLENPPETR